MEVLQKNIIILTFVLLVTMSFVYFLVSSKDDKKILNQTKEITSFCKIIAEKQAREDLKAKYGDALNRDFVLGSPHYQNRYNQCLSKEEK